jgi:hydrogenase maturation protease
VKGETLVACIGNIFLGDDAFGVEVARRLLSHPLPARVTVMDFGIRAYDLAYALMEDWELVILVDALPLGGKPGTVYALEAELPAGAEGLRSLDAHTMNPVSVLQLVSTLGGKPGRILVVGCEPETVEPDAAGGMELSPGVKNALDEAVQMVMDLITRARSSAIAA